MKNLFLKLKETHTNIEFKTEEEMKEFFKEIIPGFKKPVLVTLKESFGIRLDSVHIACSIKDLEGVMKNEPDILIINSAIPKFGFCEDSYPLNPEETHIRGLVWYLDKGIKIPAIIREFTSEHPRLFWIPKNLSKKESSELTSTEKQTLADEIKKRLASGNYSVQSFDKIILKK